MSFVVELLLVAVGTYALRSSVILLASGREIPARAEELLRLIPPAVLTALVANALFYDHGNLRPFGPWYVACAIAAVVATRTKSVGWTLVVGMVAVWVLTALW